MDVNPGDRAEKCAGMMKPVGAIFKGGENIINHRCARCGFERSNKVDKADDFDIIVKTFS